MLKHIIIMAAFMCVLLFGSIFLGEYFILEPEEKYRSEAPYSLAPGGCCIFPGRKETFSGDALYSEIRAKTNEDSRHMTWVFHFFVFL